ncbi:MAG: PAS domain-containing sensor histidine kinase [Verrucomicrobiota bacterium]
MDVQKNGKGDIVSIVAGAIYGSLDGVLAMEATGAGFWDSKILLANEGICRMTGYDREELMGKTLGILQGPKSNAETFARMQGGLDCKKSTRGETTYYRKNGEEYLAGLRVYAARDAQEKITHYICFQHDITDYKEVEARASLKSKLESIGQLSAGIAHEINTPAQFIADNLSFLKGNWETILKFLSSAVKKAGDDEVDKENLKYLMGEIPQALTDAIDGVQRITTIIKAMKEFSHPQDIKAPADLNHAIESTVTVARNEWKYVADVETRLDATLPPVPCFLGDFNQVILNLLVNAAQAIGEKINGTGQKGKIVISTSHNSREAVVTIEDNGPGVPEKIRARLFDPFFTTKPVGKGTGQGLYMAHQVIEGKHGGTIRFDSEEGKGTKFHIKLPL